MKAEVGAACSDAACSRFIGVYRRNNHWPDAPVPATADVGCLVRRAAVMPPRVRFMDYASTRTTLESARLPLPPGPRRTTEFSAQLL